MDATKLQAQLVRCEGALAEEQKQRAALAKELDRHREMIKRGDAELKKAVLVINQSKQAQALSQVMEERDMYQQQSSAMRDVLRVNAEELEKYKKLLAAAESSGRASPAGGSGGGGASVQQEQQARLVAARGAR